MKTFIKIYKAMLLWSAIFSMIVFALGLESMVNESRYSLILIWLLINIIYIWLCKTQLTYKDVYELSGTCWIERTMKEKRL